MESQGRARLIVKAGDLDGLARIYSEAGALITEPGEELLRAATGWDATVRSPWRRFLPKILFAGFGGQASRQLFVTNKRIVLVRESDPLRDLQGGYSTFGLPTA